MTDAEREFIIMLKNFVHPDILKPKMEVSNWDGVFLTALNQNLLPVIYNEADDYPGFSEFDKAHSEYMVHTVKMVSTQIENTSAFLLLYKAFLEANLTPIVVKGIACRSLYGEYRDFRVSGDEDILIEKKDYGAASAVLSSCGYKSTDMADKNLSTIQEVTFYNYETGLTVEMHLNPFGEDNQIRSRMNRWFRDVFSTTETIEVDGVNLCVLSKTDNLLFLLFHGFKHFLSAGMGIRMALDILLYIEKFQQQINWMYIMTALEDVRATAFTADLIAVGKEYLGFDLNIEGLDQPISPNELLEDMFRMGTFGVSTQIEVDAARFTELAMEGKRNGKITDTFYLIFPSWDQWKSFKPYLVDRPWMLPVEWFRRLGRYLRKRKAVDFSESRRIAERRIELMKRYGVV